MVKSQIKNQSVSHAHVESVQKSGASGRGQGQPQRGTGNRGRGRRRGQNKSRGGYSQYNAGRGHSQQQRRCDKCNLRHARDCCFAKGKQCRRCHGYDHFAVCCNRPSVQEVRQPDDSLFLGSVTTCNDNEAAWEVKLKIFGKFVNFKIDSGADTSVMCETTYRALHNPPELKTGYSPALWPRWRNELLRCFHG